MSEALSQKQIDELLNKMKSGKIQEKEEEQKGKIKEYDFASPKKFTKDQIRSLSNLYENFSRVISSYFTSVLRTVTEVTISEIEEQRYYEFSNSLPDNILVGMFSFKPEEKKFSETSVVIELATRFGFLLIDRLLGGNDVVDAPDRGYTAIELELLQYVLKNVVKYFQEVWSNYIDLTSSLTGIETNGRLLQAFSPQDTVVIVSLEIKDEHHSATANICMPAENLEEIINSFSIKYTHSSKQQDPEKEKLKREVIMDNLKFSDLEIEAILDNCRMSVSEIANLQVNDVIALNKRIDGDIYVNLDGVPWYTARLGEVDRKKAVKLVEALGKSKGKGGITGG